MLTKENKTKIKIRPFALEDLEEVMAIEPTAFGQHHWSRQAFVQELDKAEGLYFIAYEQASRRLLGYSGLWILGQEAHITTLAVRTEYRRQYIGEQLLINSILEARCLGVLRLTLEVRASNEAAQKLYSKYGFSTVNTRPHYYQDNFESALILWSENITTPEFNTLLKANIAALEQREEELAGFSRQ